MLSAVLSAKTTLMPQNVIIRRKLPVCQNPRNLRPINIHLLFVVIFKSLISFSRSARVRNSRLAPRGFSNPSGSLMSKTSPSPQTVVPRLRSYRLVIRGRTMTSGRFVRPRAISTSLTLQRVLKASASEISVGLSSYKSKNGRPASAYYIISCQNCSLIEGQTASRILMICLEFPAAKTARGFSDGVYSSQGKKRLGGTRGQSYSLCVDRTLRRVKASDLTEGEAVQDVDRDGKSEASQPILGVVSIPSNVLLDHSSYGDPKLCVLLWDRAATTPDLLRA